MRVEKNLELNDVDHSKQILDNGNNNYSTVLKENVQKINPSSTDKLPITETVSSQGKLKHFIIY